MSERERQVETTPGTLTINNHALTFKSNGTYKVGVNSNSVKADQVIAKGVTINSGAQFSFADSGTSSLPAGTVFTVIANTATTVITGVFGNLADGSVFASNGNNYQASYTGGTGNDLTLTVVP